jgi:ferritin-like metal-binding protein YciE
MLAFEILPQVLREVETELLARPLGEHLEQTRAHAARVEELFAAAGAEVSSARSHALEGLRREHDETVGELAEPHLKDVFLAAAAAKTEHLEIALYSALIPLARRLGIDPDPLQRNLAEEGEALQELERAAMELRERLPE